MVIIALYVTAACGT